MTDITMPDLALVPQPQINVIMCPDESRGLIARVVIDNEDRIWILTTQHDGEGLHLYESHTLPNDAVDCWTSPLRLPVFRHHPVPTDPRSMIEFARWFFAPKVEQ